MTVPSQRFTRAERTPTAAAASPPEQQLRQLGPFAHDALELAGGRFVVLFRKDL